MKKGAAGLAIVLIIAFILLGAIAAPLILVGTWLGGGLDKYTGMGGPNGYGCFISDENFTNLSVIDRKEEVIGQITAKWAAAKTNEKYVREVFDRGQAEGINPLIPLAIWAGEQTFANPEKAFGYGYRDSGTINGVTSWEAQLNGVFSSIHDAINATGNYNDPIDSNRFTRLFYNYTTAMHDVYVDNGNVWNEEGKYKDGSQPVKARLAIFRLVANDQITCQSRVLVAGARTGNDGVPLYKQADFSDPYGSSTIAASGCCTVSAAMVMRYFGIEVDPVQISNISFQNEFYVAGEGTDHAGLYPLLANQFSLKFNNLGTNWGQALDYLERGLPLIARGEGAEPFTSGGHCIVLTGYDPVTQMVRVNNPANGDGPYPLNYLKGLGAPGSGRTKTTVIYFLGNENFAK